MSRVPQARDDRSKWAASAVRPDPLQVPYNGNVARNFSPQNSTLRFSRKPSSSAVELTKIVGLTLSAACPATPPSPFCVGKSGGFQQVEVVLCHSAHDLHARSPF